MVSSLCVILALAHQARAYNATYIILALCVLCSHAQEAQFEHDGEQNVEHIRKSIEVLDEMDCAAAQRIAVLFQKLLTASKRMAASVEQTRQEQEAPTMHDSLMGDFSTMLFSQPLDGSLDLRLFNIFDLDIDAYMPQ